ncbi:MAG: pilus assembly protein PilP [Burkholderiales bacterium]|jgi:type IV pilus assembly protein PilP|nr:pilus assembly protein PilP [Burkholderiales bacterium]
MKRALILIGAAAALAGCDGGEFSDLKAELATLTKDVRGKVEPLPVVKPYEPVGYQAFDQPDPFGPAKIQLATKSGGQSASSALAPDLNRPKEPLEAFPLESLKMVGVLQQKGRTYGLVKADASIYRIRPGNYVGQNFGVVTQISETEITLRELIQEAGGDWTERNSNLQLQEAEAKK